MNIEEAIAVAEAHLREAGVPESRRDAMLLTAFALGKDDIFIRAHSDAKVTASELDRLFEMAARRAGREPIQYITGRCEFYGLDFMVTPDVLIPRPETETLVEQAVEILLGSTHPRFCEIGVGSGCISISILAAVKHSNAVATDISNRALEVAGVNAAAIGVDSRLKLVEGDGFENIGEDQFDLVVSNPPYVPDGDLENLQAEVKKFEPRIALVGGSDGLSLVRRIVSAAPEYLVAGGCLLMEVGFGQEAAVRSMFSPSIWKYPEFMPDLQGIPRIAFARKRN